MQKIKTFINENKNYIHRDANGNNAQFDEQIGYLYLEDVMGTGTYYTRQETGYILNKHEYDAWGYNTKAATYNYDPEYRATEPYFTGHPYDGALNLYYSHNRFFDAQTGQWLSEDPIKSGLNWYQYCNSNPTSYVDVLGLEGEEEHSDAKVYIFYQEGMYEGWTEDQYNDYTNNLKEQIIQHYGYEDSEVEIVSVAGEKEFVDKWNHYLPNEADMVVINFHANPWGYEWGEPTTPEGISNEKTDTIEKLIKQNLVFTSEDILCQLDYKDVNSLINLGCNSNGYGEDSIENGKYGELQEPYTHTWLLKGVKEQVAAQGYITFKEMIYISESYYAFGASKYVDTGKINDQGEPIVEEQNGLFWKISGCGNLKKSEVLLEEQLDVSKSMFIEAYHLISILERYDRN